MLSHLYPVPGPLLPALRAPLAFGAETTRERHDTMPPTFFSKNLDLKLIELVKENPVLYNPRHAKYTDSDTREVTWQKIGDGLGRPAAEFAGIQCQVHFGDLQDDKHKPGFIENMKEFMPEQYANAWGIEKKIFKEYRKQQGLSALDAKNVYTKKARALPTYGVTFFLVKEKQKDKKKLIPRLLGISAKSILRLDEHTKEILQQWPLTHVKTYHATKGDIFTLNFGDYSEKDYSVKTLDACRIRDILEDYIDLIRKRMLAPFGGTAPSSAYLSEDMVSSSQANVIQHMSNNSMKGVEQCFVGPSQIVSHEVGKDVCQGTQFVTVQQVVVSGKGNHHQQGVRGEVAMRGDMSIPFTRRLNRLNCNSVKIVTLLTVPSNTHMEDARKIVDAMNEDLPFVREGVQETIGKQGSDEDKKKLQNQMNELDELMRALTDCSRPGKTDTSEVGDVAMQVADLTTNMYFAVDAKLKRRSQIISRSRPSFVEDENTQKTLRKASFIAAASSAAHALDDANALLREDYSGPALDGQAAVELEAAAVDKLGKLNAAIAHYILAHSDPKNVDYETAVNSMNTIHELLPDFCKEAQALASAKEPLAKRQILLDAQAMCDAVKKICSSTGMEDQQMLDLADDVAAQTSQLLMSAQQLTQMAPQEAAAAAVDAAGVAAADAAKGVITQVQLCACTISEPHCQLAVTAAAEALSAAVQRLASAWKPLVDQPERHVHGESMHQQVMQLARALDALKAAYCGLGGYDEGEVFDNPGALREQQRLQFINTVSGSNKQWHAVEELLTKGTPVHVQEGECSAERARLAARLGQLNAAIASLLADTSDRDKADYAAAERAVLTINELMPQVVQDTLIVSANEDAEARKAMLEHIKALCDASKGICTISEDASPESRGEAIAKYIDASGKLVFGISHRSNPDKENQILELSEEACRKMSQLLAGVQQLSEGVGGDRGGEMDARRAACAGAGKALLTTAQVTALSISSPRCQTALLTSIDRLSSSGQELAASWKPLHENAMHKKQVQGLEQTLEQLGQKLDALRGVCMSSHDVGEVVVLREQQRLQFGRSMAGAQERIHKAQKALDKPLPPAQHSEKADAIQLRLSGRLGELSAAVAALLAAAGRAAPDYKAAEDAARTLSELLPYVVQDTQSTCANKDEATRAAMLDLIRELCEASRAVCKGTDGTDPQGLSDAVSKFSDASGKLIYVVNPRANANRENQIMGVTAGACNKASQLLSGVEQLSKEVGGGAGAALDARGAALAEAAQALLAAAQITAPSISEPHCKKALLSSIDKVSSSGRELPDSWQPLLQDPKHELQASALQVPLQQLETQLEALRKACQIPDRVVPDEDVQKTHEDPSEQKVQFGRRMSLVTEQIQKAQKALDKPLPAAQQADRAQAVQHRLAGRLGELNAAIAALLAATSARARTDYKAAEQAVRTITDLIPHVVQDTQSTCANKDEATRAAMLDLIKELCEASRAVCATADGTNPQGLSDAVSKFSDASGKLVYVVNPRVNTEREKQIDDESAGACSKATQLLAGVQQLSEAVGGARGQELDSRGAALADATQTLLATSQVTGPSVSEPHCKQALLSCIDKVSSSARELSASWQPLRHTHQKQVPALDEPLTQLETHLEALRKACQIPDGVPHTTELPRELQKLQFVKTMSTAKEHIQKAQMALDKPIPLPQSTDLAEAVEHRLSGRLGELNAAIAALLAATADIEKLDYKTAEEAMRTITQLMPEVVQDTQSTCANKDETTRAAMLDLIKELCEASRAVCATADGTNPQAVHEAAAQFSRASGKLVYAVNPRANADTGKQIVALSVGAQQKASKLLGAVQKLPTTVEGRTGQELEAKSAAVDEAAQNLVTTAKTTAAWLSRGDTSRALAAGAARLARAAGALVGAWRPLLQGYSWSTLNQPLHQLHAQLEELTALLQLPHEDVQVIVEIPREQQKHQFGRSMSLVVEQIQKAQKALDKPLPAAQQADRAQAVQHRLAGRLGELNAAIAALLVATADKEKPDYETAEKAAKTISEVLPHVVEDTQSTCANKDEATRAAMLDLIKELCEASRAVCATADGTNPQGLSDAASKFSDASGKLVYTVSPLANEKRENQIVILTGGACKDASQLLAGVQQLSEGVGGTRGGELDARGAALADAAHTLLRTSQMTAPSVSEPHCQSALLSCIDKVSSAARELSASWQPLRHTHQKQVPALDEPLAQLETHLEALRKACQIPDGDGIGKRNIPHEQQKLQFMTSMSQAKEKIRAAQQALDKPIPPPQSSDKAEMVQQRLSGRLGQLNAAIASLLSATADREKPYYQAADKAIKTIADLLPHVIEDTQSACANQDPASRAAMLDLVKQLSAASEAVCAGADGTNPQGLSEAVGTFCEASGKLVYVLSPHDKIEAEQIVEAAARACGETSRLLAGVQRLAGAVRGARGGALDERGAALADAAQALLASAQVTAPSISESHCKAALLSSADLFSSYSQRLAETWKPLLQEPKHQKQATALEQALQSLEAHIEALREACSQVKRVPPPPTRRLSRPPPAAPAHAAPATTQEFLHRQRGDEEQASRLAGAPHPVSSPASPSHPPTVMTDDEKRMHQQFMQAVDDAHSNIENAKKKAGREGAARALSVGECMPKRARLQRNIALAAVDVAELVGANYGQAVDYPSASKSMKSLPQLMSNIMDDGKILSSTVSEESRKAFLKDMLEMCDSSLKICDTAKNDREKLNDAAVDYGDTSAKLLYVVSNDVDPSLEKEIINRAKAIGDGVASISSGAGAVASAPLQGARPGSAEHAAVQALCAAGTRCQDGAGRLLYTAKLVAPSIYEVPCQEALHKSADSLVSELRTFTASWKPFSTDTQLAKTIKELKKEAENLERILEGLKSDVKGGRIGQRKEMEKLVVEDTPMRQLTLKIMEDAKHLSESSELSPALRREYVEYSARLRDALRPLELATARCSRTPHDTNKRRELENAIHNLQMVLLQSRPSRSGKEKTNIVDLRDFISEVTSEVDKLGETAGSLKVATAADKKALQEIIGHSQKMSKAAYNLTHSDDVSGFDTTYDNILDVDQFGQECDDVIKDINAQICSIEDAKARTALHSKMLPFTESCNMLRFATKSGISTAKSVTLDATLDDLDDIESRVIRSIVKEEAETAGVTLRAARGAKSLWGGSSATLCRAACARAPPRAPLTAYVAACAASADTADSDTRNRLLKHLFKLVHLMKTQTISISKRVATWQSVDDPQLTAITEQILQEIEKPESQFLSESSKQKKILNASDLTRLLTPAPAKVVGDAKCQDKKLCQLGTKLSCMSSALTLGIASPEALVRSAHATADAALELSAVARGSTNKKEPVQCGWIEEAVQEMLFTTYDVLKQAEQACLEPSASTKRRLFDACLTLNQYIDKLMGGASRGGPVARACGAMERSLRAQQPAPAPGALPYEQCCAALHQHQETVYKLKSDQPMSRAEFARSLGEVNEAVCKTTEISSQCAYLISVSEKDSDIAKKGPVDVPQIQRSIEALQDSCMTVIGSATLLQAKEETEDLHRRIEDFSRAIDDAQLKVKDGAVKATLTRVKAGVATSATDLWHSLKNEHDMSVVTPGAVSLLEEVSRAHTVLELCPLVPSAGAMSAETKARCDELTNNSKSLLSHTMALVKDVSAVEDDSEVMTWVTFNTSKTRLLDAYDALVKSIRVNGQRAGILEGVPEEESEDLDAQNKTYLEMQVGLANKWLNKSMCKAEVKATGQQAVRHVIDIATKISEELKGSEREEMRNVITETEDLLAQCSVRYDSVKYSVLSDRVKELKKAIQRGVVTRVVEDFIEVDDPVGDLDIMLECEEDEQKRKFLLERKIAELLAQLGRVRRTARFVADAGGAHPATLHLMQTTEQTELLAPMLVQAAQERIASPNNQAVIDNYKALLAKYEDSISKVRALCDRAVDPMDFVQTAGDTMQRMREESTAHDDVQKGHRTSEAIIKLANRSIEVSMSSLAVRRDPELRAALLQAQQRVLAATPAANCRPSRLPDWKESTAEVLRTTGELESALGGENIFKKPPAAESTNQQIYAGARALHACVREWSARDNDIVAAARRVAVHMARLADCMDTDKTQSLISESKSIVAESREVAALATRLAHECTDRRIQTNLLQTCERIPTISAQLKMLTTVKGSSLGHQGSKEDSEAMDMLVGNAQSLMMSIQEVVKAAAGASVKIMSQRGPKLRWVRKNYY